MGRAKKALSRLEEMTRKNSNKIVRDMQQQSTRVTGMTPTTSVIDTVDVANMPTIIQPGTIIHDVGVVTDTDVRYDGHSVQVRYTVTGISTNGYVVSASEGMPATRSIDQRELEDAMRLHIKGILHASARGKSTYIQRMITSGTYDISTLVDALDLCESTLQSVYALTRIAGEMDDVDYHRFLQSLRTLIVDESGVELDAQQWSTPLENSDGRGSMLGDGLLNIYEKNGSIDHMDGVAKEKIRVTCTHCNAGQLFDNGVCKLCGQYLPYPGAVDMYGRLICGVCTAVNMNSNSHCGKCGNPLRIDSAQYAQEMYGTFLDSQQVCTKCGATIEDEAYTCCRCGVSVYSSPIYNMVGHVEIGYSPSDASAMGMVRCWHCSEMNTAFDMRGCKACGAPFYEVVNGQYVVKTSNGEIQKMGDTVPLQWDEVLDKTGVPKLGDKDVVVDME